MQQAELSVVITETAMSLMPDSSTIAPFKEVLILS
jgi:hypothetical protein